MNTAVRPHTPEFTDRSNPSSRMVTDAVHEISLSGKKELTVFPDLLLIFKELEYIDLSNTGIRQIPAWVCEFRKLKVLNLSGTLIDDLPIELNQCPNLTVMLLKCDNLVTANLRGLKKVNLVLA